MLHVGPTRTLSPLYTQAAALAAVRCR
jgi:hypothetical protein